MLAVELAKGAFADAWTDIIWVDTTTGEIHTIINTEDDLLLKSDVYWENNEELLFAAYSSWPDATTLDVYSVRSDGSELKKLTTIPFHHEEEEISSMVFDKDGKFISYILTTSFGKEYDTMKDILEIKRLEIATNKTETLKKVISTNQNNIKIQP